MFIFIGIVSYVLITEHFPGASCPGLGQDDKERGCGQAGDWLQDGGPGGQPLDGGHQLSQEADR